MHDYIVNGLLHRANGPAYSYGNVWWLDGEEEWGWFLRGEPHRYYGPQGHGGKWWIHCKFIK
jgi:hypothetical protein